MAFSRFWPKSIVILVSLLKGIGCSTISQETLFWACYVMENSAAITIIINFFICNGFIYITQMKTSLLLYIFIRYSNIRNFSLSIML